MVIKFSTGTWILLQDDEVYYMDDEDQVIDKDQMRDRDRATPLPMIEIRVGW